MQRASRLHSRRAWLLIGVFAVVIVTDQVSKWWAWRHVDGALINDGGYILLGPVIRSWFAAPVSGAVANVVGLVVVTVAVSWLLGRGRSRLVLIGGGFIAAGLLSNILDRLGLRAWTAPGTARGVIDFIPSGGPSRSNVADVWIVLGVIVLVSVLVARRARARRLPHLEQGHLMQ
jgi:lipoprotein signal peptidase